MKRFKTEFARTAPRYEITPDIFKEVTKEEYPFEQKNDKNGIVSQYGICPSCLNPIQLIGISRKIKITPYGKHTGKTINGLPDWVQRKYEYCPFSAKNDKKEPNDDEMLLEIDNSVIELYNLLKSQFDRIVYIIGRELKIQCTGGFWGKVLQQFIINNGHFYPWLTEVNLPYIFAYLGMRHNNIWNQKFLVYRFSKKNGTAALRQTLSQQRNPYLIVK